MDINTYHSYEEPRTASRQAMPIKSTQSWKTPKSTTQSEIITTLNNAAENRTASFKKTLLGYAPQNMPTNNQNQEAFQMGDVIDVINPLHHLPIVGTVYRGLTDNELHPVSGIIGGALYGGPVGAITGTANAISKIQTGKDIGAHAFDMISPNNEKADIVNKAKHITMTKEGEVQNPSIFHDDVTTLTLAAMPPRQVY